MKFLTGFIAGLLMGTLIVGAWAAMSGSINDRRYDVYTETAAGETALLVTIAP